MSLHETIKQLPSTPGVYYMKDSLGGILYVGKAKNIKKRIQSYFRASANHSTKIQKLVQHVKKIEFTCTDTEFEAFMLECQLIKELKPPYNRQMKNPLSFVYIVITNKEGYFHLTTTTHPNLRDEELLFGPYTSIKTVERAILGIQECFKILCKNPFNNGRACLNYDIGLCIGTCIGGHALEEYQAIMRKMIGLLNGTDFSLIEEMTAMMDSAALDYDFEMAAVYRDYISAIHSLIYKEKVMGFAENMHHILVIEKLGPGFFKYFLIHHTKILYSEKVEYHQEEMNDIIQILKRKSVIFFSPLKVTVPHKIGRAEIDEAQIIYRYINGGQCHYLSLPNKWLAEENEGQLEAALTKFLTTYLPN
jgi:excinuclease ABC subunit C